mmetsp:Transcript_8751/g.28800  ORF Transcript_8751/g.28800 Transcript_8751/m.28800 type:complete len:206 (+) Transcript_8751:4765-5382(+)
MDLVDDDEAHELRVRAVAALASDDVPLLGSRHDDLRLRDLLVRQRLVAGELAHDHAELLQAFGEVQDALLDQSLHRRHVDNLKGRSVDLARLRVAVRGHGVEHAEHSAIRLARARRRAEQNVLRRFQRRRPDLRLDRVQRLHAFKRRLHPLRQRRDGRQRDAVRAARLQQRGHVHLFITLLLRAPRFGRQLADLVRHVVAALRKG